MLFSSSNPWSRRTARISGLKSEMCNPTSRGSQLKWSFFYESLSPCSPLFIIFWSSVEKGSQPGNTHLLFVCKMVPLDPLYFPQYADQCTDDAVRFGLFPEANRNSSKLCCQMTHYYTETTCRSEKPHWELDILTNKWTVQKYISYSTCFLLRHPLLLCLNSFPHWMMSQPQIFLLQTNITAVSRAEPVSSLWTD